MTQLPDTLIFLRHGRTISNEVYSARRQRKPVDAELEKQVMSTPDWKIPLNDAGLEQAHAARNWIDEHLGGLAAFDGLFSSYFTRCRHTAGLLGPTDNAMWQIDDRLAEQHYGIYTVLNLADIKARHPEAEALRAMSPWYAAYPGGESGPMMRERYRSFANEKLANSNMASALIVAHAGLIGAARYHIEHLLPEEKESEWANDSMPIRNGAFLLYGKDSTDDTTSESYTRRRIVVPGLHDSGWVAINSHGQYSQEDLLAQVDNIYGTN